MGSVSDRSASAKLRSY